MAVCLLTPAAAWAKGASSTPSYSFPAAVRGSVPLLGSPSHASTASITGHAELTCMTPSIKWA